MSKVKRPAISQKVLVLGSDGFDPRLAKKYIDEGKLPNLKKFIDAGACRDDLMLLGGHPTVTPPMWTTLATGCYSNVHGITGFDISSPKGLDWIRYSLDSSNCKAEQLWNVFAEEGKKTLVWHWPGSSWPPSSDSPNLLVVDGTSPGSVGMSFAQFDGDTVLGADTKVTEATFFNNVSEGAITPCSITGMDIPDADVYNILEKTAAMENHNIIVDKFHGSQATPDAPINIAQSPIADASGWANAPAGAKEITMLLSGGLLRRPCLVLKNEAGTYDRVAIYKSKKESEPIAVLSVGTFVDRIEDEGIRDDKRVEVVRNMKLLEMAPDGSNLRIWISASMEKDIRKCIHPVSIYDGIVEKAGYAPPTAMLGQQSKELINDAMLNSWYVNADWQAKAIKHLIDNEGVEVVFSHFHAIDLQEHMFIRYMTDKGYNKLPPEEYHKYMEDIYIQTDWYFGQFLKYLDEGWSILLVSDHAQVCSKHDFILMGDVLGINVGLMEEIGLTRCKRDENGNRLPEIDWENTLAIAQRETNIYVNLKGRDEHGIVDPADKYEVEEEIMSRLYSYRHPQTGKRVIALAVRNKDAVHFGLGGPECGDIVYFMAEGYQWDHADSLSTSWGECDTSVSPFFVAAGKGIKKNFKTDRIIRQIDVAATAAALGGVRFPKQCEGAPVYQIFEEEF
ncbi:MAG: alkaline phosphatase family protein [Desulfobulbus sp.]|jgi:predicted AlkP superfamily phosphohydrolase/phosphomutase|uniref:alkaline phosphatase family protein n=1 Tax=Desulfobulbus sp. TaxID=895 RepID=UPI0028400D33|nr:alkaline phosphatase family protein [Desulfobulbus sp.]MDR2549528.1 alkaline phosphatase family protein [Desulfobulbus sp.]